MQRTLVERSYLPSTHVAALGDKLTLGELAELRASSLKGGTRQGVSEQVLIRMLRCIGAELASVTIEVDEVPDGWEISRSWDRDRDSPLDLGKGPVVRRARITVGAGAPTLRPGETATKVFRSERRPACVTRAQAGELYALDQEDWSAESLRWIGIDPAPIARFAPESAQAPAEGPANAVRGRVVSKKDAIRQLEQVGYRSASSILDHLERYPWARSAKVGARTWDVDELARLFKLNGVAESR